MYPSTLLLAYMVLSDRKFPQEWAAFNLGSYIFYLHFLNVSFEDHAIHRLTAKNGVTSLIHERSTYRGSFCGHQRPKHLVCTIVYILWNPAQVYENEDMNRRWYWPWWPSWLDHRFQHLGCRNDRLASIVTHVNHHLLSKEDLLDGYLHSKIAPSNHDAIGFAQDLLKVDQTFLVLDLTCRMLVRQYFAPAIPQMNYNIEMLGVWSLLQLQAQLRKFFCIWHGLNQDMMWLDMVMAFLPYVRPKSHSGYFQYTIQISKNLASSYFHFDASINPPHLEKELKERPDPLLRNCIPNC
jgi:hypothetical protein